MIVVWYKSRVCDGSFNGNFVIIIDKFMYWHFKVWVRGDGGWLVGFANMHSMSNPRHVGQMHYGRWHVHASSHDGMMG